MMKNVQVKLILTIVSICFLIGCTLSSNHAGPLKNIICLAVEYHNTAVEIDKKGEAAADKQNIRDIQNSARKKYKLIDDTEAKLKGIVEAERNKTIPFEQRAGSSLVVTKILLADASLIGNDINIEILIQAKGHVAGTKPLQCKMVTIKDEVLSSDTLPIHLASDTSALSKTIFYHCKFRADRIVNMSKIIVE
jgi:hypothetical protein